MGQRIVNVRLELDRDTDSEVEKWARTEGKSKRRHLSILTRKLIVLRRTSPAELAKLGLLDQLANA